jgi:hypothetical protein
MTKGIPSVNYQKASVKKRRIWLAFCLATFSLVLLLTFGCQTSFSHFASLPSPSPSPVPAQSYSPSWCGVFLSSEMAEYERLCAHPQIIGRAGNIPPQTQLASDPVSDWYVFECDVEYSHKLASTINRRICGINSSGSNQVILVQRLVGSILVSEDGQWLVFAAAGEEGPGACGSRLYKMALDAAPIALSEPSELNICSIHNLQWQHTQSTTWVRFRNWDGSGPSSDIDSMPIYRVNFENGDLERTMEP